MRLLIDTTLLVDLSRDELAKREARFEQAILSSENVCLASAASLWEIAIKTRLGKLDPQRPLHELPELFETFGLVLLGIDHRHALHLVQPQPPTRDPFDRMLLAQCAVEELRLVTRDRALAAHPLAWRAEKQTP
jgi:PIN domain nuclease of toxin-antitoxin system